MLTIQPTQSSVIINKYVLYNTHSLKRRIHCSNVVYHRSSILFFPIKLQNSFIRCYVICWSSLLICYEMLYTFYKILMKMFMKTHNLKFLYLWYAWYTLRYIRFVTNHACAYSYDLTAVESILFFHCLFMTLVRFLLLGSGVSWGHKFCCCWWYVIEKNVRFH